MVFPGGAVVKNSPANERATQETGSISGSGRWDPRPGFLPGKLHGQRSLAGPSPWDQKELDATEYTHTCTHTHICTHTQINTCVHTCIDTHIDTHMHACTHTHTCTHTYTHTHTQKAVTQDSKFR